MWYLQVQTSRARCGDCRFLPSLSSPSAQDTAQCAGFTIDVALVHKAHIDGLDGQTDGTGHMLLDLCDEHFLVIMNTEEKCLSKITWEARHRQSSIDYCLMPHKLYTRLETMEIDENKLITTFFFTILKRLLLYLYSFLYFISFCFRASFVFVYFFTLPGSVASGLKWHFSRLEEEGDEPDTIHLIRTTQTFLK